MQGDICATGRVMLPPTLPWVWGTPSLGEQVPQACPGAGVTSATQQAALGIPSPGLTLVPRGGPSVPPNPSVTSSGFTRPSWGSGGRLEEEPVGVCPTTGDFGVPWLGGAAMTWGIGEFEGTNPTRGC